MVDVVTIYIIIAAVFSILLLIMALTGGLGTAMDLGGMDVGTDVGGGDLGLAGHDVATDSGQFSGAGISPLSLPILFAFGSFFGGFGAILELLQVLPTIGVPFFAAGLGAIITAALYFVLVKLFAESQATTVYNMNDMIGMPGEVTIPVGPGTRGQVLIITEARGRTLLSAVSNQTLGTGERVKVTGVEGNALAVEKA